MVGELIAWSRPWRRGGVPGASVRQLDAGMAEFIVLNLDGPPTEHGPMPERRAIERFEALTDTGERRPAGEGFGR